MEAIQEENDKTLLPLPHCRIRTSTDAEWHLHTAQVDVCFLYLPPGFQAAPRYFNRVSISPGLNQPDPLDFALGH